MRRHLGQRRPDRRAATLDPRRRRSHPPSVRHPVTSLGIATLEGKIAQRAVVEVLNAIYETGFQGFSYGFRPGRSPHHALDALAAGIEQKKVSWVLDADIREFFTSLDHRWLVRFLEHRIADQRILRLMRKWLSAGVIENGTWTECDEGAPQGGSCAAAHKPPYEQRWVMCSARRLPLVGAVAATRRCA
ncbi:MAG: reverse transcriptase domain-containing protein [Pseudonocardiaceae bacterium]